MTTVGIDPGPKESAYVVWDGQRVIASEILPNWQLKSRINTTSHSQYAIEMIASYGMAVGKEVFETCVWIGRFAEYCDPAFVYRKDVKMHLCGSMRAKDANIRQALIDRFGEPGTKKNPGPLYGIKSHLWAALAVAVYYHDNNK